MSAESPPSRRTRAKRLKFAALIGAIVLGLGFVTTGSAMPSFANLVDRVRGAFHKSAGAAQNARVASEPGPLAKSAPAAPVAKVKKGRNTVSYGVMLVPEAFEPAPDGTYDLIVHFNGNVDLTLEGLERLDINAVYVVINLGIGSSVYEQSFAGPNGIQTILNRIPVELKKRGLPNPRLGRLALTAWSAGYGAIMQILAQPKFADQVDSIVLLDGLHTSLKKNSLEADPLPLTNITAFAKAAIRGERLLTITHSNVEPVGYASVRATTDLILGDLALERSAASGQTSIPDMASVKGVLPRDEMVALVPVSTVDAGSLHVRGYKGNEPTHHISHLLQASEIAFPTLAARWKKR
jgi:hypothetical protein